MIVSQAIFGYLFTAAIIMVRNYDTHCCNYCITVLDCNNG